VAVRAIELEVGGGAGIAAEVIEVGGRAGNEEGERDIAGSARESGALEGIRGEGVGERIHGKSYLTERDVASASDDETADNAVI
jgi:hypothetical protein